MAQPTVRIFSADQAAAAARALETPTDVKRFVALGKESTSVRAFLTTPEWAGIYYRVMGDGKQPGRAAKTLGDVIRLLRWTSDGSLGPITSDPAAAYRHAAMEVEALEKRQRRDVPVSPAPVSAPRSPGVSPSLVSFVEALAAVKAGGHSTRLSWPTGTYVTAQAGYPQGIAINGNTARATGLQEGATAVFGPYLLRGVPAADGTPPKFGPWTPDHDDLFAEDWQISSR